MLGFFNHILGMNKVVLDHEILLPGRRISVDS